MRRDLPFLNPLFRCHRALILLLMALLLPLPSQALTLIDSFGNSSTLHPDPNIDSPKSVIFKGSLAIVNSLEGARTVLYNTQTLKRVKVIVYPSDDQHGAMPVESVLTHQGRYLWITHYRIRSDIGGRHPSTVSVIDTHSWKVVRTLPAGPVPKILAYSPATQRVSITNWGDNTVHLWDVSSPNPQQWHLSQRIVVGGTPYVAPDPVINRDQQCGLCLRGTVFSPDGQWLLVARMHAGGVSIIHLTTGEQKVWYGAAQPSRHLLRYGDTLYLSSTRGHAVSRVSWKALKAAFLNNTLSQLKADNLPLLGAVRTIAIAPKRGLLFAAENGTSSLVEIDLRRWQVIARLPTAKYPVGLGVTPDETQVWVTAQGRRGQGGNQVSVYRIDED